MQQLEIVPISDSINVITELLGIKSNSLYMPLLNDDEMTFILNFFKFVYVVMVVALCERSLYSFLYFMYYYIIDM